MQISKDLISTTDMSLKTSYVTMSVSLHVISLKVIVSFAFLIYYLKLGVICNNY